MIKSIAVTFLAPTQEHAEQERDKLFDGLFGKGKYAVGGAEVTPYELSDPREEFEERTHPETGDPVTVVRQVRDTLSWQATYAAHPVN
jgi:hypothetical protein